MTGRVCVIRADASAAIGTGHVVRCRTLAAALAARGWRICFAAREVAGLDATLREIGEVVTIPATLDPLDEPRWLAERVPNDVAACVTDSYAIGADWQASARAWARLIVAIDDIAEGPQDVDLLVNQNLGRSAAEYAGLVSVGVELLVGPRYALLRPEFAAAGRRLAPRTGQVHRALVFMGGSDAPDVTARAAVACVRAGLAADVVVGPAYPRLASLRRWAKEQPLITLHHDVAYMADLMIAADVAIGAGGSASWERCSLGLPSVLVVLAENQVAITDALVAGGCAISLGWHDQVDADAVLEVVTALRSRPDTVREMSAATRRVTDGGGTERVVDAIEACVAGRGIPAGGQRPSPAAPAS